MRMFRQGWKADIVIDFFFLVLGFCIFFGL